MLAPSTRSPIAAGVTCVLDVGISLRPTGLHWALALAGAVPTWLPQVHWCICEEQEMLACDDRLLMRLAGAGGRDARASLARTARLWREARDQLGFESRPDLFWHGFGRAGSIVPKDGDAGLIDRVDALAAGFDNRRNASRQRSSLVADCARDVLALAAGLACRNTVILAPREADEAGAAPFAVRELDTVKVPCVELRDARVLPAFEAPLMQALVATGLAAALIGGGQRLAAVAVVAPRASQMPAPDEDELAWQDAPTTEEAALWDDAAAVWWALP